MPGKDGIQATKEIVQLCQESGADPPVIIGISGYIDRDVEEICKDAGMVRVVTKPLPRSVVINLMQELKQADTI